MNVEKVVGPLRDEDGESVIVLLLGAVLDAEGPSGGVAVVFVLHKLLGEGGRNEGVETTPVLNPDESRAVLLRLEEREGLVLKVLGPGRLDGRTGLRGLLEGKMGRGGVGLGAGSLTGGME